MSATPVRLSVTTESRQGGRKYMEDYFDVRMKWKENDRSLEYAYFAILDGHGGSHAAEFAKQHLFEEITKNREFWSDNNTLVCKSIRDGFISTHKMMSKQVDDWPKTLSGHPSTAGTTASVIFIKNNHIYVGHVGDSAVVMGRQSEEQENKSVAFCLTKDHKPDDPLELQRIKACGGNVASRAGVHRVVWQRHKLDHSGPITRSTECEQVPFLAVARSLGDLWSYNSDQDVYIVSPEPDVSAIELDLDDHCCLVLASDGLWNMIQPQEAIDMCQNIKQRYGPSSQSPRAAALLIDWAMKRWTERRLRADNTTALVVYLQHANSPPPSPVLTSTFPSPAPPLLPTGVLHRVQSTQLRESPHALKLQRKPTPGLRHSPRASPTKARTPSTPISPRKVFSFNTMFASPVEALPPGKGPHRYRRHSFHGAARRPRAHKAPRFKHQGSFNGEDSSNYL